MDKKRYIKIFVIMIIAIIILLFDIVHSISQELDYQKRKESGNSRWLQIEERILQTEEEIQAVKEKLQ